MLGSAPFDWQLTGSYFVVALPLRNRRRNSLLHFWRFLLLVSVNLLVSVPGTYSKMPQEITLARVVQAGVAPIDTGAVAAEPQRTWNRRTPGNGLKFTPRSSPLQASHRELQQGAGSGEKERMLELQRA
jgi:hypothetical protein